jgi:hypothetical protein
MTNGNYIVVYTVEILDQISDAVAHIGLHVLGCMPMKRPR